jgi:hypothetical protein
MRAGLSEDVFAAAEADLKPNWGGRQGLRQSQARQGEIEKAFLAGAQLMTASPAIKTIRGWFDGRNHGW